MALLMGLLWLRDHDARIRETASAERSRDSLVAAVATVREDAEARRHAEFLNYEAARQRAASELAAARRAADASAMSQSRLLDSLAAMLPDTMSPYVSRLLAGWQAHLDADLRERGAADSTIALLRERNLSLESAYSVDVSNLNVQIDECLGQLDRALKRTRPGLLTRIVRAVPVVLATIGAWEGLKKL